MEDMLKKFMEQQSTFNKNMTDSMTQQTQALKRQVKVQDDMNIKLNEIKKIVKTLNEHEVRLGKLEQHNESLTLQIAALSNENQKLSSEVCLLKQSNATNIPKLSSEIIISGVILEVSSKSRTILNLLYLLRLNLLSSLISNLHRLQVMWLIRSVDMVF
ncbi:hypothetical protein PV328_010402 [Microctonus aethiopoides]|uniref:Uncharacterized protein n=1 Tax=Microctonus aethiopoides TaxID=144406 RepID=A0AA39FHW4_9HYME|nr:hypothetical protein PV328_010402 [Microctonus aethiopoides]